MFCEIIELRFRRSVRGERLGKWLDEKFDEWSASKRLNEGLSENTVRIHFALCVWFTVEMNAVLIIISHE